MSMYTAMVLQYSAEDILRVLELLSKNSPPEEMKDFVLLNTRHMGKARFFLNNKQYYIELSKDICPLIFSQLKQPELLEEVELTQEKQEFQANPQLQQIELDVQIIDEQIINAFTAEVDMNARATPSSHQKHEFRKFKINNDYFDITRALILTFVPLVQEYDIKSDAFNLEINLKPTTKPRLYQQRAIRNVVISGKARSGLIVLPCGAGKTLVGVMCIEQIKSSTIIICDSNVSVDQWKREIEKYTTIDPKRIIRATGFAKDRWLGEMPIILLTTYSWLVAQVNSKSAQLSPKQPWGFICDSQWGICVVDEVHRLPAQQFQNVLRSIKCAIKIGLTATLLREDQKLDNLYFMIGPKLYEENLIDLMNQGFLAKPYIIEVFCDMSPIFLKEYKERSHNIRQLLQTGNPTKFRTLQFLIKNHEMLGHKIIVFCDSILVLNYYAQKLGYPVIDGDLNTDEKNKIFGMFKNSNEIKTIFTSRVGDTGVDIPGACVGIEIGYLGGSRRQKVQRLGRVMRPKPNDHEIQAFFYSLASKETAESEYSYKRQKYITEQLGLNTELLNEEELPYNRNPEKYKYIKPMDELELLETILVAGKDGGNQEAFIDEEEVEVLYQQRNFTDELAGLYKVQQQQS